MSGFCAILRRDLLLSLRQASDSLVVLLFFVLVAILFPFGVGPEPNLLARMAPGVVWVAALLAAMLSLDRLFGPDYEDGSLEQLVLSPTPLFIVVIAKAAAHWITTGLPLLLAAPVIGVMYGLAAEAYPALMISMALGTPLLSLIGTLGAALTLGARRGGILLTLLVLPLVIPVLIFGTAAIDAAVTGLPVHPHLLLLAGLLLAAIALVPIATAAAIRQAME